MRPVSDVVDEPGPLGAESPQPGDELELTVGRVAHGGHWVARHEGRVVFVRHALEGERVRARVTGAGPGGRYLRADAVEVLEASTARVTPPCPYAGPGRCGGCDLQHVALPEQRALKAAVVREQLSRLAGLDVAVEVEPVPGDDAGLRWRTRVEFAVDDAGRAGLRRHRSHDVVPVEDCLIADERVVATGVLGRTWHGAASVDVVAPSGGPAVVVPVSGDPGGTTGPTVTEVVPTPVGEVTHEVAARGFWQVHRGAPAAFVGAVVTGLRPEEGDDVLDLYSGVGLLTVPLARAVGGRGRVRAVEGGRTAVGHARRALAPTPWASAERERVDRYVRRLARAGDRVDLVVLDPPRVGAKRAVVRDVVALGPRRVVYVACDPAALARDTGYLADSGYALTGLRAFDAFPMTHHVECVAVFEPA